MIGTSFIRYRLVFSTFLKGGTFSRPCKIFFVNLKIFFTQYIRFFFCAGLHNSRSQHAALKSMSFHETRSVCCTYIGGSLTQVYYVTRTAAAMNGVRGKDRSCQVRCVGPRVRVRASRASRKAVARYCSYCWGVPRPAPRSRGLCNLGEASKPASNERRKLEVSPGKVGIRRHLVS